MALSNWDTLTVDENGPVAGRFVTPLGVEVEVYKNWLFVHDPGVPREKPDPDDEEDSERYSKIVMELHEGDLTYRDLHVWARRGPDVGVYFICWHRGEGDDRGGFMVGTGIYGYDDCTGEWLGVRDHNIRVLRDMFRLWTGEDENSLDDDCYLGIHGHEGFEFSGIDPFAGKLLRYNQGDKFFADNLFGGPTPATEPGKSGESLLVQAIKTIKNDES